MPSEVLWESWGFSTRKFLKNRRSKDAISRHLRPRYRTVVFYDQIPQSLSSTIRFVTPLSYVGQKSFSCLVQFNFSMELYQILKKRCLQNLIFNVYAMNSGTCKERDFTLKLNKHI